MSGWSASRRAALGLTLAAACWGVGTALSKQAVAEIPPLTVLAVQLMVSLVFLAVAQRFEVVPGDRPSGSPWLARLGVLNPGLAYALSLIGLTQITVSLSVLLWALEPLLILALAAWFLRERVGPALLVLSALAVSGMLLVVVDAGTGGQAPGIALTLAGVGCCATYTVATRRWLPAASSTLRVVSAQQTYALGFALILLVVAGLLGDRVWPTEVTLAGGASLVVSGVLYYGLAYSFYLAGLRHMPASLASAVFYLIPVFGIAAGTALGERLEARQWVGAGIVILAVALVAIRMARAPASAAPNTLEPAQAP
jgi:probable blue pigment (indigoidine) exporter